jgi:hypothetical protein
MDLLTAATNAASLKKFIEEDITSHLVRLEFGAAAGALSGLELAQDKASVYWSAINHLESVEESLKSQLRSYKRNEATCKYIYVSALKAAIYKYLGEDRLVQKCLNDTLAVVRTQNINAEKYQLSDMFAAWKPSTWTSLYDYYHSELGKAAQEFNPTEYWKTMTGREESFYLLTMSMDN